MEEKRKQLIAIDGNSLMHRAYYALPPMTSRDGTPTGAIHGFLSMLLKLIERGPDYLAVAFDLHGPTFRHLQYGEYKAGRRETPDDLRKQFPLLQEILRVMGIAVCTAESYEADDILGTFAHMAKARGDIDALLVTGDKDALQLISESAHVLLTKKGISETLEMDEAALMEAYGLTPERMRDLKGLMGDNSDNIPGIPGVGEKTALKLLHEYGTLEGVLENGASIKGKIGEKVRANAESARMSYTLGIIQTDAPMGTRLEDVLFYPERMADAEPLLKTYQLNAIVNRLPKGDGHTAKMAPASAAPEPLEANGQDYTDAVPPDITRPGIIQTGAKITRIELEDMAALLDVVSSMREAEYLAIHAEGDALSLAVDEGTQFELHLMGTLLEPGLARGEVIRALAPLLEAERPEKLMFDAKRIMHLLGDEGITLGGLAFDAMIADYLLHAIQPMTSLNALVEERLPGCPAGAAALHILYREMVTALRGEGLYELFEVMELPLIDTLYGMEATGFLLDVDTLHALDGQFAARIEALAEDIYALAGERFNILSTKQLGSILFEKLQLPTQRKTKTGYSTDADVLDKLIDMHPIVKPVQEYRFLTKLKSTFVDGLLNMVSKRDGRVHTSFNQNVTATGRISSTEPNLQNIPARTPLGREIRKAFIASAGNVLVGADYSQIELRLLAHISGDEAMIASFLAGGDIHAHTAAEVFDVRPKDVTADQRGAAKAVNFGIVYGISDFGLARNLNISRAQAHDYIERYLDRYPGVRAYMRESVERGKRDGYVSTLFGRKRALPELQSRNFNTRSFGERVALNMPIQGTAADIIKLAMVRVDEALRERGLKSRLILQVHDELILDVPANETEEAAELLRACMQNAMELSVPLTVDVKTGLSWYDTK